MNKQFVMLSGLPRTGSTLLSAILSQNPKIHAPGNSALCQLMWDLQQSCNTTASEQLKANNRLEKTKHDLLTALPELYYKDVSCPIILDKCRSWTLPANMQMARAYLPNKPKVIVLTRRFSDIIKSFAKLRVKNNYVGDPVSNLFIPMSEPVMRSLSGVLTSKKENTGEYLFVDYEEIVSDTRNTIKKIYDFCEWEHFDHNFQNIENKHPENDEVYGLKGQHEIRSTISKAQNEFKLPEDILNYCDVIDDWIKNADKL